MSPEVTTAKAGSIAAFFKKILEVFLFASMPIAEFFFSHHAVKINMNQKIRLFSKALRHSRHPDALSSILEVLVIVNAILKIPPEIKGDVAEFGCYKGWTTATLSLACAMARRKLYVFDSFCGLPHSQEGVTHILDGAAVDYQEGQLKGSFNEVKKVVSENGDISVCKFIQGFYENTLPEFKSENGFVIIFEDADLPSSVKMILQYLWPQLKDSGVFFSHEARDLEVVKLFYDESWWNLHLSRSAPGFVGSGTGLMLGFDGSCLGYIPKNAFTPSELTQTLS